MKPMLLAAAALALATAAVAAPVHPAPAGQVGPGPSDWRTPDPDDVLVIDTNKGRVVVEMVPEAAPLFVARVRELARQHVYDGLTFFRVIGDFMAQTGDPQNNGTGGSSLPDVPGEFTFRRGPDTPFALALDRTVDEVGFVRALPVQSQSMMLAPLTKDGRVQAWGLFCEGVVGAARAEDPNSANSQFFLMRATRPALDRRYTAFGRVLAGQEVVMAIKTGEPVPLPQDNMVRVRLLSDLPAGERPRVRVIDPKSAWLKAELARQVAAKGAEFSACDVDIPAEVK